MHSLVYCMPTVTAMELQNTLKIAKQIIWGAWHI